MKSHTTLKAEIYNALKNDSTLIDNILWINSPTTQDKFPLIVYRIIDAVSDYNFCGKSSELFQVQIDIYSDSGKMGFLDGQYDRVVAVMEGLKYRQIGGSPEIIVEELNKVVKVSRWETVVV